MALVSKSAHLTPIYEPFSCFRWLLWRSCHTRFAPSNNCLVPFRRSPLCPLCRGTSLARPSLPLLSRAVTVPSSSAITLSSYGTSSARFAATAAPLAAAAIAASLAGSPSAASLSLTASPSSAARCHHSWPRLDRHRCLYPVPSQPSWLPKQLFQDPGTTCGLSLIHI